MKMNKMNKMKVVLVVLVVSLYLFPSVNAAPILKTLAPWSGDSQTDILAIIRPEKRTDNTAMHLYIFWNHLPIVTRLCDTVIDKKHTYMWDVTFNPPQDLQYLKKGSNTLVFWLEDVDGKIQTYTCIFTVTDRIPDVSWFNDLPQAYIDKITGPAGEKGDTGLPGPTGPQGETGKEGPKGPTGSQGESGDVGPQGEIGPIGPAGIQGELGGPGPQGEKGEVGNLNIFISGATLLMSIAALVIVWRRTD